MVSQRRAPVYVEIAAEIQGKAAAGFYGADNKLPSRKEICEKYNVSDMTAWKVHGELERTGVAYRVKGRGVFAVNAAQQEVAGEHVQLNPLGKLAFFAYAKLINSPGDVSARILRGAQSRAFELGLNIRTELFSSGAKGSCRIMEDEGLIVPYNSGCEWLLPLMEHRRIRCVLVNNYFSEAHCVVNDNYSGISQLLDHLEAKGCRRLLLATRHFNALGIANLSDRTYAFERECQRRGLGHELLTSGNFSELLGRVKGRDCPDAVMFTSDSPALKFKDMMAEAKLRRRPMVTGFDGWRPEASEHAENLTTVRVDYEGMGAAAVDLMCRNTLEDWHMPDVLRVPCELLVGK